MNLLNLNTLSELFSVILYLNLVFNIFFIIFDCLYYPFHIIKIKFLMSMVVYMLFS